VQGLVHRDIKPANILLENGVERVKLTDFGLARAVDDASLTQSGVVAGTPQYMAPEQAGGEAVDHRADLFSLGSVLYAMCTGRPPFRARGTLAVLRRVCEDCPRPIPQLNPEIPAWLVALIARLHAKVPGERVQSAAEVGELLSQHQAHLRQPALVPRSGPLLRRGSGNKGQGWRRGAVAAAVLLMVLAGLALTEAAGVTKVAATVIRVFTPKGTLVVEVDDPRVQVTIEGDGGLVITGAGPQEVRLRPGSYQVRATRDGKPLSGEVVTITRGDKKVVKVGLELTDQAKAPARAQDLAPGEIRRFEPYWGIVTSVAVSPDGGRALFGGEDTVVWLADLTGKKKPRAFEGHTQKVLSVTFSPDGRRALSGGQDATVRLWDVETGKELRRFQGHRDTVWSVAFSPDGRRAVSGGGGQEKDGRWVWPKDSPVCLWDVETGKELRRFTGQTSYVMSVAFSPDGRHVLAGGIDTSVRLWDVETGKEARRFEGHVLGVQRVGFSRAGDLVFTTSADRTVRLWDAKTGKLFRRFGGHRSDVSGGAFSPDGRYFVSCSWDKTVRLWNVESGEELHRFEGHSWSVRDVVFSPDGRSVLSAAEDGTVRLWRLPDL
jgi:WD40 repeat protein